MPNVTFVQPDGAQRTIAGQDGFSVMETAVNASVDGIVAECGGACACATCQVYVDEAWAGKVAPPTLLERSMIEDAEPLRPHLRLSCQIVLDAALDGLVVHVPASQY